MSFRTSPNKNTIRRDWDAPILRQYMAAVGHRLRYFGMTGPEMHDVLTWRDMLFDWTSIEEAPKSSEKLRLADRAAEQILQTASDNGLADRLEVLRGGVEDVICDGVDVFGARVRHSVGEQAYDCNFNFDLYNLDFDGGLGYRAKTGKPKRIRSLEKLFQRQNGRSFILLLTVNVRDTLREQVIAYLKGVRGELGEVVEWYIERKEGQYDYQLKAAVPLFLRHHAEAAHFSCTFLPPVSYVGFENARLAHFVCRFEAVGGVFPAASPQSRKDVIELPLVVCKEGILRVSAVQHPGFLFKRWSELSAGSVLKYALS